MYSYVFYGYEEALWLGRKPRFLRCTFFSNQMHFFPNDRQMAVPERLRVLSDVQAPSFDHPDCGPPGTSIVGHLPQIKFTYAITLISQVYLDHFSVSWDAHALMGAYHMC